MNCLQYGRFMLLGSLVQLLNSLSLLSLLQMVLLLKEFLSSGDVAEATRCLQELEVPHFHHELVYEVSVY